MKQKVVTFGEIMLRLAPEGYYRFVQADTLFRRPNLNPLMPVEKPMLLFL